MEGQIVRILSDKGFGFIKGTDGQERFFHRSAIGRGADFASLREGQSVTFEEEQSDKGPRCKSVALV